MTAVRFRDSARYGLRLYAYALGITILGGAGVGLGAALAWPEVQAWRGPGIAEPAVGAGGGVLLFLGLSILATGYFGIAFKLLADGVAAGSSTTAPAGAEPAAEQAEPATADPNVGAEPEPQSEAVSTGAAAEEPTGAEVGSMAGDEAGADTTAADPPEPSPEEIAFGNSGGEEAEAAAEPDPDYEDSRSASGSDTVANQNADADPLADPSDEG